MDFARENPRSPEEAGDPWDPALRCAFAQQPSEASAVMQSIHLRTGRSAHVALPDLGGERPPLRLEPRTVDWRAGTTGRYAVRGELARGGVGTILLAHDSDLGRDVAVKILHEHLADDASMLQRFVEEAQIGGQLQHPGIVPVYELGLDLRQLPYFTMKLVQGQTLAQLLAARSAPSDDQAQLLDVFARVCDTVAYAHARGVVHRDLKPGNIMVGEFGEVLVMDWGFAKLLRRARGEEPAPAPVQVASDSASIAGAVLGTPPYMPPEQAAGAIDRLDARADVFALGAILCEILTGTPPYPGREPLQQARDGLLAPALARLAGCGADPALIELASECLQRDPAQRPESARAVRARLAAFVASANARADAARLAAASAQARVIEERKRRRLWLVLATTALGLLGVAGALLLGHRARVQHTARVAGEALSRAWQRLAADDAPAAMLALGEARAAVRAGTPDAEIRAALEGAQARISVEHRAFLIEKELLEALLRPWWDLRPGSPDVVDALARVGVDVREPAEAIAAQARALPDRAAAIVQRAMHDLAARPRGLPQPAEYAIAGVLAALDALDDDPWHRRVRQASARDDVGALREVHAALEREDAPASAHELLGMAFLRCGAPGDATAAHAAAHAADAHTFWINYRLAMLYRTTKPPLFTDARWHAELAMAAFPGRRFGMEPPRPPGPPPGRRGRGR